MNESDKEFQLSEKNIDYVEDKIIEIRDTLTDLRKEGKDPFMQVVELKELRARWGVVRADPTPELFKEVKNLLKKIKTELTRVGKEEEENILKDYQKKDGEE